MNKYTLFMSLKELNDELLENKWYLKNTRLIGEKVEFYRLCEEEEEMNELVLQEYLVELV